MEKISSFQIRSVTLSGFKCFDTMQSFDLGNLTMITGANHTGKSSIADAVAFAITGTTFFGETHIDRLYSESNPNIEVRLLLCDQDGNNHELVRKRKKDRVTVSYDGYNLRQQDLNELFGERDVFLSIFNPLYFIEELGDDGKALLEKFLPFVDRNTVMAGVSEYTQHLLRDKEILAPETYIKNLRDEVRELRDCIISYEGQSVLLMTQRRETSEALNLLKIRLDQLQQETAALQAKQFEGINSTILKSELDNLVTRYNELLSEKPEEPNTAEQEQQLRNNELALERTRSKVYESKFTQSLAEVSAELKLAYEEHRKVSTMADRLQTGTKCPLCFTEITEAHLLTVKNELAPQLREIVTRGQGLKAQLTDLQSMDKQAKETFHQFKLEDIAQQEAEIFSLQQSLADAKAVYKAELQEYEATLQSAKAEIQNIQDKLEFGSLSAEEGSMLTKLLEEQRQVQADFAAQQTLYMQQTDTTKEKIAEVEAQIKQKEQLISAVADYAAKRAELTFEQLTAGDVRFKLFDVMKTTGEIKDCFKFTYQGRDYKRLSRSERILAGVSTAELIKQLTGRNYPMYIDDSESVTGIPKPTGQVLLARVVASTPLQVKAFGEQTGQVQVSKAA